jgi:hypothetical protein
MRTRTYVFCFKVKLIYRVVLASGFRESPDQSFMPRRDHFPPSKECRWYTKSNVSECSDWSLEESRKLQWYAPWRGYEALFPSYLGKSLDRNLIYSRIRRKNESNVPITRSRSWVRNLGRLWRNDRLYLAVNAHQHRIHYSKKGSLLRRVFTSPANPSLHPRS